jgi:hypothetical protein
MTPSIGISGFAAGRHGPDSEYTAYLRTTEHGQPDWLFLTDLVEERWADQLPGYTDGVILVPVRVTEGGEPLFTCPVSDLRPDEEFVSFYRARKAGETPRKSTFALRSSIGYAPYCFVVLYSREKLLEGGEASTGADWDVVTILSSLDDQEPPMAPGTLMANHFGDSGGSATNMSPEKFEAALRRSYFYWRGRTMTITPEKLEAIRERIAFEEKFRDTLAEVKAATAF